MIAMDANGKMAVGCTTSGWAFKKHGRVDSHIIGAGIYVDPEIGGAYCYEPRIESIIKYTVFNTVIELCSGLFT